MIISYSLTSCMKIVNAQCLQKPDPTGYKDKERFQVIKKNILQCDCPKWDTKLLWSVVTRGRVGSPTPQKQNDRETMFSLDSESNFFPCHTVVVSLVLVNECVQSTTTKPVNAAIKTANMQSTAIKSVTCAINCNQISQMCNQIGQCCNQICQYAINYN